MTTDPASGDQAARHDAQQAHSQPSQPEPPQRGRAQGTGSAGPAPDAAGQKNPYVDFTGYRVRMPASWPTSVRAALPSFRGGIGSIVRTAHMPMDARIGYWVWLIGCVLAIIGWVFSIAAILLGILFNPIILVGTGMMSLFGDIRWGVILFYLATMMLSLVVLLLQLTLSLKIREGAEWARAGLTALTVLSIVYSIILTAAGLESGGGGTVAVSVISLALLAFFWMPQANAWFLRTTDSGAGRIDAAGAPM